MPAYASPADELKAWIQMRQQRQTLAQAAQSGDPAAVKAFNDFLDQVDPNFYSGQSLSQAAKNLTVQNGMALNPETGQYDIKAEGLWSHPETWIQAAAGAALGGAAAGLFGGAGAGGAGGGGAAPGSIAAAGGEDATTGVVGGGVGGGAVGVGGAAAGGATSWLGKNATGLIGVGGQLANSAIQAVAAGKATEAQTKLAEEALQYEKSLDAYKATTEANRYGAMANAKSPYVQEGSAAASRFGSLLGLTPGPAPAPPPMYAPAPIPGASGFAANPLQAPAVPAANPNAMVMLKAPDGTTRTVPAGQADQWRTLGYA